ncbi:MAG TPA: glycosyltransferase family 9 protein [Pyrinomonadaceae bacterium]|nr:glycosyltransferase family 9 protein [Pyrinomonadaceae bacterium]
MKKPSTQLEAGAASATDVLDEAREPADSDGVSGEGVSYALREEARPLADARWDWGAVRRVLVVRLRSVGDTVLATPALHALRRFLPRARVDVLLEDWVAPLLEGSEDVDRVVTVKKNDTRSRLSVARGLRAARYDVAFNLHGGSTSTLLTRASGAIRRVGYASYRYSFLYTDAAPHPSALWQQEKTHSAEQQLGLLGWTGVPVTDRPPTRLSATPQASEAIARRLMTAGVDPTRPFALMHPAAAFESKTWATENFARVAEQLDARGLQTVAVASPHEREVLQALHAETRARVVGFEDLSLPELNALAARAALFVGNDSGVAHVAAAFGVPSVVVFGSSNVAHWRPWTDAPAEVVREEMPCAPCPGYTCSQFDAPECIRRVPVSRVAAAVEKVLEKSKQEEVKR